jgi:hypothetical protein
MANKKNIQTMTPEELVAYVEVVRQYAKKKNTYLF